MYFSLCLSQLPSHLRPHPLCCELTADNWKTGAIESPVRNQYYTTCRMFSHAKPLAAALSSRTDLSASVEHVYAPIFVLWPLAILF